MALMRIWLMDSRSLRKEVSCLAVSSIIATGTDPHEIPADDEATVDELEVKLSGQPSGEPGRDEPPGFLLVREEERHPCSDVSEREPPPAFFPRFDEPQEPFLWRHCPVHLFRPRPV